MTQRQSDVRMVEEGCDSKTVWCVNGGMAEGDGRWRGRGGRRYHGSKKKCLVTTLSCQFQGQVAG